ncbi:WSC domain-containing protein 2 [Amphibalanus amphitrite]|uniref:WSC domain-containing protein 2 n=1 Tax=Amphibalanus amphitrite TaxID=1232801 RepID=A0A6A4VMM4_AMPAM|nr:WSC domain-containing protein 2-like [Amphibalanus amphitrite]KAF0294873.1 WSC domain-containing protein 2 [Amphibalanus amphitrite]
MAGREGLARLLRQNVYQWSKLALAAVAVCGLLAVIRSHAALAGSEDAALIEAEDTGLIGGRPIADLLVASRPEHAWFTSARCRPLLTRFTCDFCLPHVYLASFPRSGNTWFRYLLEASTGLFTLSGGPNYKLYQKLGPVHSVLSENMIWTAVRGQRELAKYGYIGENIPWVQRIGIVTKTHFLPEPWNKTEADSALEKLSPFTADSVRRAVLLVRDPFKAFISLKKYGATQSVHTEEDMTYLYRGDEWLEFVKGYSRIWFNMNAQWLKSTNETHVIAYERLTKDPMGELTSVLRFLKVEPDPRRLECLHNELEGAVHNHRHGVVPDNETYPLPLRAKLWSYIHQLNLMLKERGHAGLPLEKYSFADEFRDIYI